MSNDLHREIEAQLKAWGEAIVSNDVAQIGRFGGDDWLIVGGTGAATKQDFLAAVKSGALTHDSFEVEVTDVRQYGDTALAIAHVQNTGSFQGASFTTDEWATDVFIRRDGDWVAVLTTLTPIAAAA